MLEPLDGSLPAYPQICDVSYIVSGLLASCGIEHIESNAVGPMWQMNASRMTKAEYTATNKCPHLSIDNRSWQRGQCHRSGAAQDHASNYDDLAMLRSQLTLLYPPRQRAEIRKAALDYGRLEKACATHFCAILIAGRSRKSRWTINHG